MILDVLCVGEEGMILGGVFFVFLLVNLFFNDLGLDLLMKVKKYFRIKLIVVV